MHSPERGINPSYQNHPPLLGSPHFLKSPIRPPYRQIGPPKFSLLKKMQLCD